MSGWISVKDGLPEKDVYVLGFDGDEIEMVFLDDEMGFVTQEYVTHEITHWMPLPEPPEEEKVRVADKTNSRIECGTSTDVCCKCGKKTSLSVRSILQLTSVLQVDTGKTLFFCYDCWWNP